VLPGLGLAANIGSAAVTSIAGRGWAAGTANDFTSVAALEDDVAGVAVTNTCTGTSASTKVAAVAGIGASTSDIAIGERMAGVAGLKRWFTSLTNCFYVGLPRLHSSWQYHCWALPFL
jgi:hypothetical protein